jgi:hypothetical protein
VERHLLGKPPEVVALYHRLIELARRGFAGARLGKQALRGYLDLPRRVEDPRITRSSASSTSSSLAGLARPTESGPAPT